MFFCVDATMTLEAAVFRAMHGDEGQARLEAAVLRAFPNDAGNATSLNAVQQRIKAIQDGCLYKFVTTSARSSADSALEVVTLLANDTCPRVAHMESNDFMAQVPR